MRMRTMTPPTPAGIGLLALAMDGWGGHPLRQRIEDWFDPDDDQHLLAYEHFQRTGAWPDGFLPNGVELPAGWDAHLANRLAGRWLRHREALRLRAEGVE